MQSTQTQVLDVDMILASHGIYLTDEAYRQALLKHSLDNLQIDEPQRLFQYRVHSGRRVDSQHDVDEIEGEKVDG